MDETSGRIEAVFDPNSVAAPDAALTDAGQRVGELLQAFRGAAGRLENEQAVSAVEDHLVTAADHVSLALGALSAARTAKDALLAGAARPGQELQLVDVKPGHDIVAQTNDLELVPPELRGWEDSRLLMSASELVERLDNINFRPYGRLETTGIRQLRDVFMAPNRLAERGVIAREDTDRLARDLIEAYPDLPALSRFIKPEPAMAAFMYATIDKLPADLIFESYVQSLMGHAIPDGQRVTMHDFAEFLKLRTGIIEPLPNGTTQHMDALGQAAVRAGRKASPIEIRAVSNVFDFVVAFHEARRAGGRPPRADSNPFYLR